MSIMTRFLRLCRADAHGVMDQLEDKGLLLKQAVRDMADSLGHKERQAAALTDRLDRLTHQVAHHTAEIDKLERDINLALTRERDDIARRLIRRRRTREIAVRQLTSQIEALRRETERLAETLANQRIDFETLKVKADAYARRIQSEGFHAATASFSEAGLAEEVTEEEVELELLQRKEAAAGGGAS